MEINKFIKKYQNFLIVVFTFFSGIFSFYILKISNSDNSLFILQLFYWSILFEISAIFLDETIIKNKKIFFYYNKTFIFLNFIILIFLIIKLKVFISIYKIFLVIIYAFIQIYYIFLRSIFRFKKNINLFKLYFSFRNLGGAIIFYFFQSIESYFSFILLYTLILLYKYKDYIKFNYVSISVSVFLLGVFYTLLGALRVIIPINYFIYLPNFLSILFLLKFSIFNNLYNIFIGYIDSILYSKEFFENEIKNLYFKILKILIFFFLLYIIFYKFFVFFSPYIYKIFHFNLDYFYNVFYYHDIIFFLLVCLLGFFQHFLYVKRNYIFSIIISLINILIWGGWFVYF